MGLGLKSHGSHKCVGFKLIHYVINLNVMSSSRIISEFDSVFLSNVLMV